MTDITNFSLAGNRITFDLDDESFTVKYPDEYNFGRPYLDLAKEFALCLWANKAAFTHPTESYISFKVEPETVAFWKWIAHRVNLLDHYQDESGTVERFDFENDLTVESGSDPSSLIDRSLPDQVYEGALVSQSTGKESVASKLALEENGIDVTSVFIEYSSRAATHKIDTREEFAQYFDTDPIRIWSDFNTLQSTLGEYTDNFEPVTVFWEIAYVTMELLLAAHHGLRYILVGSQLDTGECFQGDGYVAIQEPNQSYVFEQAYTKYLHEVLGVPIVHTSNIRPFTGFTCRLIVADREPEFMKYMHNCLRPNTHNRWCKKCYKCNNAWVEFLACGVDPEDAGLSHDVLIENPHFAGDPDDDYGFSFPRYERDELAWQEFGAKEFFAENVRDRLNSAQIEAFESWREKQDNRVDPEDYSTLQKYQGKFVDPVTSVIPSGVLNDMGLEHTDYIPERMDPSVWAGYSVEWETFK